jgi:hypothetical protein
MKTLGMIGEVVGKASSICILEKCSPREVYENHWSELETLMQLPGKARRATLDDTIVIPADAYPLAEPVEQTIVLNSKSMTGIFIDDVDAVKTGKWTPGTGLPNYFDKGYLYAGANSGATIRFNFQVPETGRYAIRIAYQHHENRGDTVPVKVKFHTQEESFVVDMKKRPPMQYSLYPLLQVTMGKSQRGYVEITTDGAGGNVHADAVQVLRID